MADPIAPGMLTAVPSLVRRYSDPTYSALPPNLLEPLFQLDYNRAIRGSRPIPANRVPGILQAVSTGQAQAQKGGGSGVLDFLGRFGHDVGDIVRSIPHLPKAVIQEVKDLPQAPAAIQQALASGDLGKVFEAPGIRLLPGSYVASKVAPGGAPAGELLQHPLFAALDVAPYTKMGFERAAETAVGKKALARVAETADKFGVGPISRASARLPAQGNRILAKGVRDFGTRINQLAKTYGLSEEDVTRLTQVATENPAEMVNLPHHEQQYLRGIRREAAQAGQQLVDAGLFGSFEGELYPLKDYNWFTDQQDRYLRALDQGNVKGAQKILDKFQTRYAQTPPMRFHPMLLKDYEEGLLDLAKSNNPAMSVELWNRVSRDITDGLWDRAVPNVSRKEMRDLGTEIAPTWITMKERGLDPILNITVTPEQATHLVRPTLYPLSTFTPSSIRAGTWKVSPGINNFSVGLGFAEYEYLRYITTKGIIETIESNPMFSRLGREINDEHLADIRSRQLPPGQTVLSELQNRLNKDWVEWDPKSIFPTRVPKAVHPVTTDPSEIRYISKPMAKTLKTLYEGQHTEFMKTWDKATKAFRTSILPMSPRWHIYNLIGGGVMLGARTGPDIFKFFGEARKMVNEDKVPIELSRGFFDIPEASKIYRTEIGNKLGRMWQDVETKGIGKLYNMAEKVDEMYRVMAYLYGKDKALTKGMLPHEVEEAGVKLSNKILQDWDSMVPFERQTLRTIFPFYGWMRHILNYTFTYPWDHPYRASIVSNFARNEIEDWQSGLPQQFQNYLFAGSPDPHGNERAFNVKGANPFSDVGNYFTLAGFFSQLHPILGGLMESMGINPTSGKADLYPELFYNAETGRLEAKTPNPVQGVAENLLPFLPLVRNYLGLRSGDEESMRLSNPAAYRSMVFSAAGIPFVPKTVNKRLEIARSELRRQDAMQDVWANALRSGNFDEAQKYPQLRPLVEAYLAAAEAGRFQQLALQPQPEGVSDPSQLLQRLVR